MITTRQASLTTLLLSLTLLSSCSKFMPGLRKDLDDAVDPYDAAYEESGAAAGGDRYNSVGHYERNPSSTAYNGEAGRRSWMSQNDRDQARRDRFRRHEIPAEVNRDPASVSYSNTPNVTPPGKRKYKKGSRATREDFVDDSTDAGSLWASDGQTNYYFTKNTVRGIGDILTVTLEQPLIEETLAEVRGHLTPVEKQVELGLAQERIRKKILGLDENGNPVAKPEDKIKTAAAAPVRKPAAKPKPKAGKPGEEAPAEEAPPEETAENEKKEEEKKEPEIPAASFSDIDITKTLKIKAGETMLAEVVERYPNGNYKIRGVKKIPYLGGYRNISLVGVVKGTDIAEDGTMTSGKLYEHRLEVGR